MDLSCLHARISDMRRDFLHKLSAGLIRENQAVFAETLSIRGMMKSRLAPQYRRCRLGRTTAATGLQGQLVWAYLLAGATLAHL